MRRDFSLALGTSAFLLVALALSAHVAFGSIRAGLNWLHGRHLFLENPVGEAWISSEYAEKPVQLEFKVVNSSPKDVAIIGASSTCSCSIVNGLPLRVPAHGTAYGVLTVHLSSPGEGRSGTIDLFTDDPGCPDLALVYRIRAVSETQPDR